MIRSVFLLNRKALWNATVISLITIALVFYGSRELQNFDAALIAYLFGTVFAFFGVIYRYSVWLQRPPTRMYFRRGRELIFSRRFFSHAAFLMKDTVENIAFQKFIYKRGRDRWIGHFLMAFGCTLAFAITFPLTFGWIHFTLKEGSSLFPDSIRLYEAHFFGFKMMEFELGSVMAFFVFHALNYSSWMVIVGVINCYPIVRGRSVAAYFAVRYCWFGPGFNLQLRVYEGLCLRFYGCNTCHHRNYVPYLDSLR
jgi:hypothetical protein